LITTLLCVLSVAAGIIALADAISGNGAMTSLNLASNRIGSEGAKHVAKAIKVSVLLWLFWYQLYAHLTSGSTAVVCHCPQDMGALSYLDISNQVDSMGQGGLGAEGAKYLAEALKDHAYVYRCISYHDVY
jgi:hypothetical protein